MWTKHKSNQRETSPWFTCGWAIHWGRALQGSHYVCFVLLITQAPSTMPGTKQTLSKRTKSLGRFHRVFHSVLWERCLVWKKKKTTLKIVIINMIFKEYGECSVLQKFVSDLASGKPVRLNTHLFQRNRHSRLRVMGAHLTFSFTASFTSLRPQRTPAPMRTQISALSWSCTFK